MSEQGLVRVLPAKPPMELQAGPPFNLQSMHQSSLSMLAFWMGLPSPLHCQCLSSNMFLGFRMLERGFI